MPLLIEKVLMINLQSAAIIPCHSSSLGYCFVLLSYYPTPGASDENNDFLCILQNIIFYLKRVDVPVALITDMFRLEMTLSMLLVQPHTQNRVTMNPDQLAQGFIS